jgi:hypothetical protein
MIDSSKKHKKSNVNLHEVRYSLTDILEEVQSEKETSTLGQEIVDQSEISKLFKRKKKVSRGKSGK